MSLSSIAFLGNNLDQEAYQNGKSLLVDQDYKAAERAFKITLDSMDEHDKEYTCVLSKYGLAQVLSDNANGLLLCRDAASNEVFEGEVFLDLACAEWHCNNRKRAVDAIRHGVKIDADHKQLNSACAKLDCRKSPVFTFLPRGHKLNRFFGRLLRKQAEPITVHTLLYK